MKGEMVECENPVCPYTGFHLACVGLTEPPSDDWYCPLCEEALLSDSESENDNDWGAHKET